jgi:hypothetical protein
MISQRLEKTLPTSTTGSTNKEEAITMAGVTNLDHHSKVIRISISITIQINLHLGIWY